MRHVVKQYSSYYIFIETHPFRNSPLYFGREDHYNQNLLLKNEIDFSAD